MSKIATGRSKTEGSSREDGSWLHAEGSSTTSIAEYELEVLGAAISGLVTLAIAVLVIYSLLMDWFGPSAKIQRFAQDLIMCISPSISGLKSV